jgi:hypothetical protein
VKLSKIYKTSEQKPWEPGRYIVSESEDCCGWYGAIYLKNNDEISILPEMFWNGATFCVISRSGIVFPVEWKYWCGLAEKPNE